MKYFLIFFLVNSCLFSELYYHGSITDGIEILEPRLRYTPERNAPPSVYASDLPAFAASHSFPWATREGVDLNVLEDLSVVLEVPQSLAGRLNVKTYIYVVDSGPFTLVESETSGRTYRSIEPVPVIQKLAFASVTEAVEHFGGKVIIKD
jgi:hypothetical protein